MPAVSISLAHKFLLAFNAKNPDRLPQEPKHLKYSALLLVLTNFQDK